MKPKDTEDFIARTVRFMRRQGQPARPDTVPFERGRTVYSLAVNITADGLRCAVACHFTPQSCRRFSNSQLQYRLIFDGVDPQVVYAAVAAHDDTPPGADWAARFEAKFRTLATLKIRTARRRPRAR